MTIFRVAAVLAILAFALSFAPPELRAQVVDLPTTNKSRKITTGGTYQQLLPSSGSAGGQSRRSLTIENNNSNGDACYVIVGTTQVTPGTTTTSTNVTIDGVTMTAAQASFFLGASGGSYGRYYPYAPSDIIYGTCATTGDSIYVDTQ